MLVKGRKWWRVLTMVSWSVSVRILQTEGSCTYAITPESACDETNLLDVREVNTIEECQQACTANSACFVAAVNIPICQLYPDNTPPVSYSGWTYMKRVCTEPTTEATTEATTTTTPTTTTPSTTTVDTTTPAPTTTTTTPAPTTTTTTAAPTTTTTTQEPTTPTTTAAHTTTTTTPAPATTTTTQEPTKPTLTPAPTTTTTALSPGVTQAVVTGMAVGIFVASIITCIIVARRRKKKRTVKNASEPEHDNPQVHENHAVPAVNLRNAGTFVPDDAAREMHTAPPLELRKSRLSIPSYVTWSRTDDVKKGKVQMSSPTEA